MSRSARFPQGTFALIATRLMFYLGVQAAYFIGIVGVLTYELKASTMALAAAVGIFNLCIIVANACGGTLLDVKGPRVHTAATVAVVVASCLVYQIVEVSVVSVLAMSAAFGFSCGMGFPYLTVRELPCARLVSSPASLQEYRCPLLCSLELRLPALASS